MRAVAVAQAVHVEEEHREGDVDHGIGETPAVGESRRLRGIDGDDIGHHQRRALFRGFLHRRRREAESGEVVVERGVQRGQMVDDLGHEVARGVVGRIGRVVVVLARDQRGRDRGHSHPVDARVRGRRHGETRARHRIVVGAGRDREREERCRHNG
jgi:hypothetical protein